jgi:hypothetical protein
VLWVKGSGGDIGSMVTMRGYASPMNKRVQDQLGLQQNELAKILTVATPRLSTRCCWPMKLIDINAGHFSTPPSKSTT